MSKSNYIYWTTHSLVCFGTSAAWVLTNERPIISFPVHMCVSTVVVSLALQNITAAQELPITKLQIESNKLTKGN